MYRASEGKEPLSSARGIPKVVNGICYTSAPIPLHPKREVMSQGNKQLLVVAHVPSANTQKLLDAVMRGAGHADIDGVDVRHVKPLEAGPEDVLAADGVILGTTENFGYMSGAMKYFLDRIYYACLDQVDGRPFALFVRAGNDGTGAISSLRRILTGLSVKEVQEPVLIAGEFDETRLGECEELGMTMAAGLEAGIF